MESLGKEKTLSGELAHQGICVFGNKGSTDQHSYLQQLCEGPNNFFVTFVRVLKDFYNSEKSAPISEGQHVEAGDYLDSFFQGTRKALGEKGRESITITLSSLTEKTLGSLLALYERTVGYYAGLCNINAYNQPGVEAAKKVADETIALQKKVLSFLFSKPKQAFSIEQIAEGTGETNSFESIYLILERLSSNPARGVKKLDLAPPLTGKFLVN